MAVTVVFDSARLESQDRRDAFREAMVETSGSTRVDLEPAPEGFFGRMDVWSFGESRIFTATSSGVSMARDSKAARGASPEAVAIAVHGVGTGRHANGTRQRIVRTGDVMVVDVTRPFDFAWSGRGSSTSLQVPIAELGMPLDAVQRAAERLESSPIYGLVSRHLVELTHDAERLSATPMAADLGASSVHLIRALLVGADPSPRRGDVVEQTLLAQVRAYVHQHLQDPELGPDSVAAALAVSRRQLFRVCARSEFSLEQYIIGKRLAGAKAELRTPAGRARSIATVARRWGFKDPTHFTRRFHAAYGLLPRDWRLLPDDDAPIDWAGGRPAWRLPHSS
jgi:AraC-like DNA-binding protein